MSKTTNCGRSRTSFMNIVLPEVDFDEPTVSTTKKPTRKSVTSEETNKKTTKSNKQNIQTTKTNTKTKESVHEHPISDPKKSQPKHNTSNLTSKTTSNLKSKPNATKQTGTKEKTKSQTKSQQKPKPQKKKVEEEEQTDEDSAIDINDIDEMFGDDDSESEDDSKTKSEQDTPEVIDDAVPVYDGKEEYFMFMRRWEAYTQRTANKQLHTNILKLINQMFGQEFKTLIEVKKIEESTVPPPKMMVDAIKSNAEFTKLFKIRVSQNIPTLKMLDSLLNKINFSLVKTEGREIKGKKKSYYCVKPGIQNKLKY
ncbi:hypothetical protein YASMINEVIRUS_334 [Yasminevirus sp. GU-2018]|uniref:Uncharacterized protein n=1 Tax=Yasminevirus sp. GU-2018 TaxID=2420051 RepID=A0A5K0U8L8_9VIRU|nr:hypothetical protein YASMINEVIRUS_334 [Yasminevirus sp. GU-2018]